MPVYTVNQAAQILCLSPRTLRRLRNDGKLFALQVGSQVRYDEEELIRFVRDTREKPLVENPGSN